MKRRIFVCLLALAMLVSVMPVALAADDSAWTVDKENNTVRIYTAEGLRAWAASVKDVPGESAAFGYITYDGYTICLENDIDLSEENWTPILGLGGTVTIDGKGHTIRNMSISESNNDPGGNTYLGFIGDIAYGTNLTVRDLTFENAHVQDTNGDSQYSWAAVVVGHGPMDFFYNFDSTNKQWTSTPCPNATCTFTDITVKNSVVTGAHNTAAILGYSSSMYNTSHLFDHCSVIDTFIGGGYTQGTTGDTNTAAILFCMGHANVEVKDCSASGVLLYSDGLTYGSGKSYTNYNPDLWLGVLYHDYLSSVAGKKATAKFSGTNTATNCAIVYPVVFHYSNADIKEYVRVNTPLSCTWYAEEACVTPVTEIDGETMYPKEETKDFVNDEAYETQDTSKVANPLTHAVIHLYTHHPGRREAPARKSR